MYAQCSFHFHTTNANTSSIPAQSPLLFQSQVPACHGTKRSSDCCTDYLSCSASHNTDSSSDSQGSERPGSGGLGHASFFFLRLSPFVWVCLAVLLHCLGSAHRTIKEPLFVRHVCVCAGSVRGRDDEDSLSRFHPIQSARQCPASFLLSLSCRISCALAAAPTAPHTPPHAPNTPCPSRLVLALPV